MSLPLRYKICRWPQAVKCLSNNSRKLKITVTELFNSNSIKGLLIKVRHINYGTLFAAMIEGQGDLVTDTTKEGDIIPWMSTNEILVQLKKFGFDITYVEKLSLDTPTLEFLMKLKSLGYDKITRMVVMFRELDGTLSAKTLPLAIKSEHNVDKLTFGCQITAKKFYQRCADGYIYNMQDKDEMKLKWRWIDAIYNIDDILSENSDIEDFEVWQGDTRIDPNMPYTSPEYNTDLTPYDSTVVDDNSGG